MSGPFATALGGAASLRERHGRTARRLRRVERDPSIAMTEDIDLLLRAHGVPESKVWDVCDRIEAVDLDPTLVWSWVMTFDGIELAALCGSELSDDYVTEHIHEHSLPPLRVTRSLLSG